jgi:glycosyltransferase EpsH
MGAEMKRAFPDFQDNPYYKERIHTEEKKLIGMQMKSHLLFYVYYRLLWMYRDLRRYRARENLCLPHLLSCICGMP